MGVTVTGRAGTTDLVEERPGVWNGCDVADHIVELVLDTDPTNWPSAGILEEISEAFGDQVSNALATTQPAPDLSLTIDRYPAGSLTLADSTALPGEPGVLIARRDGGFDVTLDRISLRIETSATELIARTSDIRSNGWWVRISDSESGNLLALGPLRTPGDASNEQQAEARISFRLSLEHDDTLVTVTTDPLDRVPPRHQRRLQWIDGLLDAASVTGVLQSAHALRLAERARDAAQMLGNDERVRRADAVIRRLRRNRWAAGVLAITGAIILGALAIWAFTSRGDPTPLPAPPPEPTSLPASAPTPATTVFEPATTPPASIVDEMPPPFLAPATYGFDTSSVTVHLIGTTRITQQSSFILRAVETFNIPTWGFGAATPTARVPGDEEAARRSCLGATSLPASVGTVHTPVDSSFLMVLKRINDDNLATLDQFVLSAPIETFSSDPESCQTATMTAEGFFFAAATATRAPELFTVSLPDYIEPGRWSLELSAGTEATVTAPIVFEVVDN